MVTVVISGMSWAWGYCWFLICSCQEYARSVTNVQSFDKWVIVNKPLTPWSLWSRYQEETAIVSNVRISKTVAAMGKIDWPWVIYVKKRDCKLFDLSADINSWKRTSRLWRCEWKKRNSRNCEWPTCWSQDCNWDSPCSEIWYHYRNRPRELLATQTHLIFTFLSVRLYGEAIMNADAHCLDMIK